MSHQGPHNQNPYYPPPPPEQQKPASKFPVWLIVILVLIPVLLAVMGIFAVLAIFGVRKYITNAKSAEARNTVVAIAKNASVAYGRNQRLCASASLPVPAAVMHAQKYQSSASDWTLDAPRNAGFACLQFSMSMPQYYQYEYIATATTFTARATGDLNGDGQTSRFELTGEVKDGVVAVSPSISERDPDE